MANAMAKLGKLAYYDTGAVDDITDYTTLVSIHGVAFHSAGFKKTLSRGPGLKTRIILVNRRDYIGSDPYTDEERAQISTIGTSSDGLGIMDEFWRERAREFFDFLVALIRQERIPPARGDRGGVILSAWSFGCATLMAILCNFSSFESEIDLTKYIRRAVMYDPPHHVLGYPRPSDPYNPLLDDEIPPAERPQRFGLWLSAYYRHGATEETLERRSGLLEPRPTIPTMSLEEIQSSFDPVTSGPDGNDIKLLWLGDSTGFHEQLRKRALFGDRSTDYWAKLPLRYLQCENSAWEMAWSEICLKTELEEAKMRDAPMRKVYMSRLTNANHFMHWDDPARLVAAILDENMEQP